MRGNCGGLGGESLSGFQFFYCSIQFVVFFVTFAKVEVEGVSYICGVMEVVLANLILTFNYLFVY